MDLTDRNLVFCKQYYLKTTGSNSFSNARSVGVTQLYLNGVWRFIFNIIGTSASTASITITIQGVQYKFEQAISVYNNQNNYCIGKTNTTSQYLECYGGTASTTWLFSGDVELTGKPTFVQE